MVRDVDKMKNKYGIIFDSTSFGPEGSHLINLNEMAKELFNPVTIRNTYKAHGEYDKSKERQLRVYKLSDLIGRHVDVGMGQLIRFKYQKRKGVAK